MEKRLAELVAFDTQNPSGDEAPLANKLAGDLRAAGAARVETFAVGRHWSAYAVFGTGDPQLLVNAHIDTVPANSGYSAPPHQLTARNGRLHGLGSADTKGAIAAIMDALHHLNAAGRPPRGVGVLFSGDEERSNSCVRAFLASDRRRGLRHAIVCEPTGCKAVKRHRGIGGAEATATSPGGHSSLADSLPSPIVILARAAVALDDFGKHHRDLGPAGFKGLCVNVASINGGVAFNVVPSRATLSFSLRPPPGTDVVALLGEAQRVVHKAAGAEKIDWRVFTANPPFATRDVDAFVPLLGEVARKGIDVAYWTEAALYAEAGIDSVIFGPGHVEQAHTADEFVDGAELHVARETFLRVFSA